VLWGPSRHLGSSTAANWVSFDLNVSCSSCWDYSLINTLKLKKKKSNRLNNNHVQCKTLRVVWLPKHALRDCSPCAPCPPSELLKRARLKNCMRTILFPQVHSLGNESHESQVCPAFTDVGQHSRNGWCIVDLNILICVTLSVLFLQDIRKFTSLAAGMLTYDITGPGQSDEAMPSYSDSVVNAATDDYMWESEW